MKNMKKAAFGAVLAASTLTGAGIGAALLGGTANAQIDSSSSSTAAAGSTATPHDPTQSGHVGANGVKEVLLTGDTASSVTSAAQAAVPDGTVDRVENDAEGATYEAHMHKADGSRVTVKLDASFNVTSIETGK
jgi:hypothetical protein